VSGALTTVDGDVLEVDRGRLLAPLERGLRALAWALPALSVALLLTHA
jgi:hypothetical protein